MAQMDGNEKDAIRELLDEWLARFGVKPFPSQTLEKKIVREGLNYVLDNNYHRGAFDFDDSTQFIHSYEQEMIAYVAEFFVELNGAYDITPEMQERILQLKSLVKDGNIPYALIRA